MRTCNDARAPLIESAGCHELDADMSQMTPTAAAVGCSCSLPVTTTEIETAERAQPRGPPRPVKQPDAAMNSEKPKQPRKKLSEVPRSLSV